MNQILVATLKGVTDNGTEQAKSFYLSVFDSYESARFFIRQINETQLVKPNWQKAFQVTPYKDIMLNTCVLNENHLTLLDDRGIQKILREIDSDQLAKALKSVSQEVKDKVFRNMSKRAVQMLQEDMDYMGPINVVDSKDALDRILTVMQRLIDENEITIEPTV